MGQWKLSEYAIQSLPNSLGHWNRPELPAALQMPPGPLEVDAAIADFPGLVCLRAGP